MPREEEAEVTIITTQTIVIVAPFAVCFLQITVEATIAMIAVPAVKNPAVRVIAAYIAVKCARKLLDIHVHIELFYKKAVLK